MPEFATKIGGSLYDLGFIGHSRYWRSIDEIVLTRTTAGKLAYEIGTPNETWTTEYTGSAPTWAFQSGEYSFVGATNTSAFAYLSSLSTIANVVVEANIKLIDVSTNAQVGVILRRTGAGTAYITRLISAGATVIENLSKDAAWTVSDLDSAVFAVQTNTWYTIRLSAVGTAIKYYRDGTLIFSKTDSTITAAGYCGLYAAYNSAPHFHFDEIKVYTSETITMNGLLTGQKFSLITSAGAVLVTSGAAANGTATLDISGVTTRPPYYELRILDTDGTTVLRNFTAYQNDIWGGDVYALG